MKKAGPIGSAAINIIFMTLSGCATVTPATMRQRPADTSFIPQKSKDAFIGCVAQAFEGKHLIPTLSPIEGGTSIVAYAGGRYVSSVTDVREESDGLHVSHYMFAPKAPFSAFRDRMADVVACR